jgi:hypothetical protein
LKARVVRGIVAGGLVTAGFFGVSGTAQARPKVYVIPSQGVFVTR